MHSSQTLHTDHNRDDKKSLISHQLTVIGGCVGIIFPLVAWSNEILKNDYLFSWDSVVQMHSSNPTMFIIDLAPFVLAITIFLIANRFEKKIRLLTKELDEKNHIIQKNASIAKMIGEKNFSVEINVERGDQLGKSLLVMRNNLAEANKKEAELNWIAQGKENISNILRLMNNIDNLAYETLVALINYTNTIQGAFYVKNDDTQKIINVATYAYNRKKYINQEYEIGQGLIGQAAFEMDYIYRKEIPEDYVTITSGILGDKKPSSLLIVPLISDEKLQGVLEFASLDSEIPELAIKFFKELSEIIAQTVFNLKVNAKTEKLLKEARIMTEEQQETEEELRQNAEEMRATQEELQKTNKNLEKQITEVENAQKRLHTLLENASEVISIYDEHGIVKYESPSAKRILGYQPEDVIGRNAFEFIHKGENNIAKAIFFELLENPTTPKTFEYQFEREEEVQWLEATGRNFLSNPAINGIIFNTRDITVRKFAEQAQKRSGQMQALSENSLDIIIRLNFEEKFYYVNPMLENYTGIKKEDLINKTLEEVLLNPQIVKILRNRLQETMETKKISESEVVFPTLEEDRIIAINSIPEFNEESELETLLLVAHDITEQKQIEQVIKDKNKKINDSINYAQRIQSAILPNNKTIRRYIPQSFIFYKPRDVVSGDFPWFFEKGDDIFIAAVDCTGHGVPGALLSFIGYFILNNIVDHDSSITASQILDRLHAEVRRTLKQDTVDADARDGMDIAFCKINFNRNKLEYAGAHRPLYFLREEELKQYKGNPKSIGGIPPKRKIEKDFINHEIQFQSGDKIFFFSDGLPDQVGGPTGRKYMASRIREKILDQKSNSMSEFSKLFAKDFHQWKGNHKQIDDVLLIGIEF